VLAKKKGAFPLTITTETTPELKGGKKCPLLSNGPITKITHINGMANWLYEDSVNRQKEREGKEADFISHPRQWGARLKLQDYLLPFIHHRKGLVQPSCRTLSSIDSLPSADELYLELKCQNVYEVKYFQNGKEIDKSVVEPYMPKRKEGERQELDKAVVLRDYKLTNIKRIKLDGQIYEST